MPHFHFHLIDQRGRCDDEEGLEFASLEVAYLEAFHAALEMSFDMLRQQTNPHRHRFEIADGQGVVLLELAFSEVLRPTPISARSHDELLERVRSESSRQKQLVAEIGHEMAAVRQTLEQTRELVARSRRTQLLQLG